MTIQKAIEVGLFVLPVVVAVFGLFAGGHWPGTV